MRLRIWVIALSAATLLGMVGGSAWWLLVGRGGTAITPIAAADRDDARFASTDLLGFLLPESEYDGLGSDPFTLDDATIEFYSGFTAEASTGCRLPHEGLTTVPAGYRMAQGSFGSEPLSPLVQQQVILFSTTDDAKDAFAAAVDLADSCGSFTSGQPDGSRESDVVVEQVDLNGSDSAIAGVATFAGYETGTVGWVVLRQANVITTMYVLELLGDELVSEQLMTELASLMQDRADIVSQEKGR
jgi:hypothetical protein